jgi:DNA-binding transcriptional regulator YiaG
MIWTPANIRALRDALGLTTGQLAKECDVSSRTARYWLDDGAVTPGKMSVWHLNRLAKGLAKKGNVT